ncbi:MAG: hypothetical protein KAT61_00525 [Gammaproteobacteria bacterium]|nr:hypothetical protein [Gammaproteobacteria bacterium]
MSGVAFLLFSCANTKITQSWVEPDNKKSYNDLLIIGIAESEQNRRAYESYFVEELSENAIEAEASYKLIKSNQKIDRDSVSKAIKGLDIDGVIVTHMVGIDEETIYRPSAGYSYGGAYGGYYRGGHYGGLYSYYPHVNTYVHNPGYYTTHETYTIETSLYDVASEELVWTARSRTFSPESVDEVIVDLTKLLIKDLSDKNLIKKK